MDVFKRRVGAGWNLPTFNERPEEMGEAFTYGYDDFVFMEDKIPNFNVVTNPQGATWKTSPSTPSSQTRSVSSDQAP